MGLHAGSDAGLTDKLVSPGLVLRRQPGHARLAVVDPFAVGAGVVSLRQQELDFQLHIKIIARQGDEDARQLATESRGYSSYSSRRSLARLTQLRPEFREPRNTPKQPRHAAGGFRSVPWRSVGPSPVASIAEQGASIEQALLVRRLSR